MFVNTNPSASNVVSVHPHGVTKKNRLNILTCFLMWHFLLGWVKCLWVHKYWSLEKGPLNNTFTTSPILLVGGSIDSRDI